MRSGRTYETGALIIGGGVTGAGVMRDLALRGVECILIDRGEVNAGASGANHGLLHSGGRYVATDPATAAECRAESRILRRIAPQCLEDCGGLFVAVEGDDPEYAGRFAALCAAAGVPCEEISPRLARRREPALTERILAAFAVEDAAVDPFRLTLEHIAHARALGRNRFLPHTEVRGFRIRNGRIAATLCRDLRSGEDVRIVARQVINASGAWAMRIARLAGCEDVRLSCSRGVIMITARRMCNSVINRLRPPADGDILAPGGTVSLLGTTSSPAQGPEAAPPEPEETKRLLREGRAMIPALEQARFIRAFSGTRPLLRLPGAGEEQDARAAPRGFGLFDHEDQGLSNFVTITGGKLTTFRLMAEKTADLVAARLRNDAACRTATEPLPSTPATALTEPGRTARRWLARAEEKARREPLICECEMVPQSAVETLLPDAPANGGDGLLSIALRSRIGKGACQGAFCAMRLVSFLYDRGFYEGGRGRAEMRAFLAERHKGVRAVLWGEQAAQAELAEAIHRLILGLDAQEPADGPGETP